MRYFHELTPEEQDEAVIKVFNMHSNDYESGLISMVGNPTEQEIQDSLWHNAGAIAASAVYIPDDGVLVVRL